MRDVRWALLNDPRHSPTDSDPKHRLGSEASDSDPRHSPSALLLRQSRPRSAALEGRAEACIFAESAARDVPPAGMARPAAARSAGGAVVSRVVAAGGSCQAGGDGEASVLRPRAVRMVQVGPCLACVLTVCVRPFCARDWPPPQDA